MSYEEALEAAGAKVIAMEDFGDYQGTWWAYVEYGGDCGWVTGAFGSCSGCDAFLEEFGWKDKEAPDYQERMKQFGLGYLHKLDSHEEAIKIASENLDWDGNAQEAVDFINKIKNNPS